MSTVIRKVVFQKYVDLDGIAVVSAEIQPPGAHEVQAEVLYSGFSGADTVMRNGKYPMQRTPPFTPGYCFVGRVVVNGPGSSQFRIGTIVAGLTMYDSEAERINFPEKYLVPVPEGLDVRLATALVLDWTTAYGMVVRSAKVSKGQRVFIHGLSGAVGYALLSLCRSAGAEVYGTASERNHAALRELGTTPFVYTDKKWIEAIKAVGGVHAVFDPLGFESYDESYSILSEMEPSVVVGYGGNLDALSDATPRSQFGSVAKLLSYNLNLLSKRRTTFFAIAKESPTFKPDLLELMELAKSNKIAVLIKQVWDLEDIRKAHESWGKGAGMGSNLIKVAI